MRLATEERSEQKKAERRRIVRRLSDYLHDPLNPDRFVPALEKEEPLKLVLPKETPEMPLPEDDISRTWLVEWEIGHPASELPTETRQQTVDARERMRQAPRNLKRMPRDRKTAR
jgi:hypothetical protein